MGTRTRWPLIVALMLAGFVVLVGVAYALDSARPETERVATEPATTDRATDTTRGIATPGTSSTPGDTAGDQSDAEVLGSTQDAGPGFGFLFKRPSPTAVIPSVIVPEVRELYAGAVNDQTPPSTPGPTVTSPPATRPPTTTAPPTTAPPTTEPPTTEPPTTEPPTTEPPTTTTPPDTTPPDTTPPDTAPPDTAPPDTTPFP